MRLLLIPTILLLVAPFAGRARVESVQQSERVLVRINGQDFTALNFGKDVPKPYLHHLRTASSKVITCGFTHHQVGIWTGHERVRGVDYLEVDPCWYKNRPTGRTERSQGQHPLPGSAAGPRIRGAEAGHPARLDRPVGLRQSEWPQIAWISFEAVVDGEKAGVTVMDHPVGLTMAPGEELVFRYRVLIHPLSVDRHAAWLDYARAPLFQLTEASKKKQ